jgi:DNA-binding MarR family transcriptional regulator
LIKLNYLHAFRQLGVDLTTEQWIILDRLAQGDGITQTELGNDSFKNAPTVSRIVELMRKKGWLHKRQADGDKRQYLIYLSDAGRQLHAAALPSVQQLRQQGWQALDDADYSAFVRIMQQIGDNFAVCDLSADVELDK